jgi:hypothetical protein
MIPIGLYLGGLISFHLPGTDLGGPRETTMLSDVRRGVGLDTCLLQAADSFLNEIRRKTPGSDRGLAWETDPDAKKQFIKAVDAFVDLPAKFIVLPKGNVGHLAPIGRLIALKATPLVSATTQSPIESSTGVALYRDFLKLVFENKEFRDSVVGWGWFQLLDSDVLLGYAARMGVEQDSRFVKEVMFEEFVIAFEQFSPHRRIQVVNGVDRLTERKGHSSEQVVEFVQLLKTNSGLESTTAHPLGELLTKEINSYEKLAHRFDLMDGAGVSLFLLAYVGSVCRRGRQYAETYSRQGASSPLVYDPHHLRGSFLAVSRGDGTPTILDSGREYWWSWGAVLAKVIQQFPTRWPAERVTEQIQALEAVLRKEDISISVDNMSPEDLVSDPRKFETMQEIARTLGIVEASDENQGRFRWTTALSRLAPFLGEKLMKQLLELFGLEHASTIASSIGVAVAAARYGLDRKPRALAVSRDFLQEKWYQIKVLWPGANPIGPVAVSRWWSPSQGN